MIASLPENGQPTVELVDVTPDRAATWLEQTNRRNRKIKESVVVQYARDMRDDKWILTHQGIAFSPDDILLDGQHRLWAIVESGRTVPMYVWRNVTDEAMLVIDSGYRPLNDSVAAEPVRPWRLRGVWRGVVGGGWWRRQVLRRGRRGGARGDPEATDRAGGARGRRVGRGIAMPVARTSRGGGTPGRSLAGVRARR